MRRFYCFILMLLLQKNLRSQVLVYQAQQVVLFEHANYTGQSKSFGPGQYVLNDFNDVTSSIRVPAGMVAYIYEHATPTQGYGISVDLLENVADLSVYNFNDKVSYLTVFMLRKTTNMTGSVIRWLTDNLYPVTGNVKSCTYSTELSCSSITSYCRATVHRTQCARSEWTEHYYQQPWCTDHRRPHVVGQSHE